MSLCRRYKNNNTSIVRYRLILVIDGWRLRWAFKGTDEFSWQAISPPGNQFITGECCPFLLLSTTDVVFALVFRTMSDSKSKGNFLLIIIVIIKETSAYQKSRYADLRGS